jgi:hypothetical protein
MIAKNLVLYLERAESFPLSRSKDPWSHIYRRRKDSDYIFLPEYTNRSTAARIFQRQFNYLLDTADIKHDPLTNQDHTLYSLRHTAICMRIILSEGQVNIFNLAKNAGTSVEQIERFYARNLPLSKEMAKNLQSFGGV